MNNITNQATNNAKEGLVNKLQDALAKFRKDRDQLHRSRELALERCRLIKAEEEALSKTVQTLRDKHNHLTGQIAKIESEMGPLEERVQKITKDNEFQHTELLKARAKIQQLTNQIEEKSKGQQASLQMTQQMVCQLRARQGARSTEEETDEVVPLKDQIQALKKQFQDDIDFDQWLAKAMDEKIHHMKSQIQFYRIQSNRLEEQMGLVDNGASAVMKDESMATQILRAGNNSDEGTAASFHHPITPTAAGTRA